MGIALGRLAQEDPSFRVRTDEEPARPSSPGMGELHLEIIVDRMKREFGVEANVGARRWRTAKRSRKAVEGRQVRQAVRRSRRPVRPRLSDQARTERDRGKGYEFVDAIKGGTVPREYIPASTRASGNPMPNGRAGRLPGRRCQGHAVRRFLPRRRLERKRLQMAASMAFKDARARPTPCCLSR